MSLGINVEVRLDEEVMLMQGVDEEGDVLAEVIIPIELVRENMEELEELNGELDDIEIIGELCTIKELVDRYEDFDRPKRLTGYLLRELEREIDQRVVSIDKVFKLAVGEGVDQKGTEWEYEYEYEVIQVRNIINEEDKRKYNNYVNYLG